MNGAPTIQHDDALVVFEGGRRLCWRRAAAAQWVPTSIWPSPLEAGEIAGKLRRHESVLVLLSAGSDTVDVLSEEFAEAPEALAVLATDPDAEVVTLVIPFLDWLPDDLRRRGVRFARAVEELLATTPKPLLPGVLLEPVDADMPSLRFGYQVPGRSSVDLGAVAKAAFTARACSLLHRFDRRPAHAC